MTLVDQEDRAWLRADLRIGDQYLVREALDTQAGGNWATVVRTLKQPDGTPVALKIMRARHQTAPQVYEMFHQEARILERFGAEVSATSLRGCGWVQPPSNGTLAARWEPAGSVAAFGHDMADRRTAGWRPALELDLVPFDRTLLALLRQLGHSPDDALHNLVLPLWEALRITREALRLLARCHRDGLFFIDHKPEHVVWQGEQVRFLDWNGGEWGGPDRAQEDVVNFVGYVAYGLFTGRQLDGQPVQAMQRGTPHPPHVNLADGERLPFYDAAAWLEPRLQTILSRPFWSATARYPSAAALADALDEYEQDWRREAKGVDRKLEAITGQLQSAQANLGEAERQMLTLLRGRVFAAPADQRPVACREAVRLAEHLRRFSSAQVLPAQMLPPATSSLPLPAAEPPAPPPVAAAAPAPEPKPIPAPASPPGPLPDEILAVSKKLNDKTTTRKNLASVAHTLLGQVEQQRRGHPHDLNRQAAWSLLQCCCAVADALDQILGEAGGGTPAGRFAARMSRATREHMIAALQTNEKPPRLPEPTADWIRRGDFQRGAIHQVLTDAVILVADLYPPRRSDLDLENYRAQLARLRGPDGLLTRLRADAPPLSGFADTLDVAAVDVAFTHVQLAIAANDIALAHDWFTTSLR
jgi:hypothetical protein